MKDNILAEKSLIFAVNIVKAVRDLQSNNEFIISNQICKSGTSIGANISEAQYAQSKADFISKLQISLKEANETKYWIRLLIKTEDNGSKEYENLLKDCNEIISLLTASINTAKKSV